MKKEPEPKIRFYINPQPLEKIKDWIFVGVDNKSRDIWYNTKQKKTIIFNTN